MEWWNGITDRGKREEERWESDRNRKNESVIKGENDVPSSLIVR